MPKAETTGKKVAKKAPTKKKPETGSGFAVIATGGKQYKASVGEMIKIEKLKGEYAEGDTLTFDKVLLTDDGKDTTVGTPFVAGSKVEGKLVRIGRAQKVIVVKYKQKSRYYKKNGHRQPFFQVEITGIK